MPLDKTGTFRHNDESARMHSKAAGMDPDNQHSEGDVHELEDHGDGTFSTHSAEHGDAEHESLGHALIHMASKHAEEGHKHFHAHHDGSAMHTHSAGKGEEPEHREGGEEEAHDHLSESMGGEDGGEEDEPAESEHESMGGEGLGGLY